MTERVYQKDSYLQEMTARIMKKENVAAGFALSLDRTIFYPESGGQLRDFGTINGLEVLDVAVAGDDIVHVLASDPGIAPLHLVIDFPRRFAHMQQHTGQHLLSGAFEHLLQAATLSFNMGEEHCSIELGITQLTAEQIAAVEAACLDVILACRPVNVFETADISQVGLRKPPKVAGLVRVVDIDGYDKSACGGTHVRNTGELALIKIIKTDRVRQNVRVYFVAGKRALADYAHKHDVLTAIQRQLTFPFAEIPSQVERLKSDYDAMQRQYRVLRQQQLAGEMAALARATAESWVVKELREVEAADIRFAVAEILKQGKCALVYAAEPVNYIAIGCAETGPNLKALAQQIFPLLEGKGGGKDHFVEGRVTNFTRLPEVLALLQNPARVG